MELGIEPTVVFTRVPDRVRPLMVSLPTEEDVLAIMNNAKMPRRSGSARSVCINRNLSKDEARPAYEARCRRRERQQQSQGRQRQYESSRAPLSADAAEFMSTTPAATMPAATADVAPGDAQATTASCPGGIAKCQLSADQDSELTETQAMQVVNRNKRNGKNDDLQKALDC